MALVPPESVTIIKCVGKKGSACVHVHVIKRSFFSVFGFFDRKFLNKNKHNFNSLMYFILHQRNYSARQNIVLLLSFGGSLRVIREEREVSREGILF